MMDRTLPPPFRLLVSCNGEFVRQGTGWFATRSKVVTAWHVIKDVPPSAVFTLEIDAQTIRLIHVPASEDRSSDIAVLRVSDTDLPKINAQMVLTISDNRPQRGADWFAKGFPKKRDGRQQTANGTVAEPAVEGGRLQLTAVQGTQASWAGSSGAAVIVDGQVAGVLTDESSCADFTLYAVPSAAVLELIPELKSSAHRINYLQWFARAYGAPEWSQSYSPQFMLDEQTLDVQKLGSAIAKRDGSRVWLIAASQAQGRSGLIQRIVEGFVQACADANEDAFDLPVWLTPTDRTYADAIERMGQELRADKALSEADIEAIVAGVAEAAKNGRVLYVLDAASSAEIERLRSEVVGDCTVLAGVAETAAQEIRGSRVCRISALMHEDRKALAHHWFDASAVQAWIDGDVEFLPDAPQPLDVLIWGRAQLIFERIIERAASQEQPQQTGNADVLKKLVDDVLGAAELAPGLRADGVLPDEQACGECLARLAYLVLVDALEPIEPARVVDSAHYSDVDLPDGASLAGYLERISVGCRLVRQMKGGGYQFAHPVLKEYFAARAMCGSGVHLIPMAEHAYSFRDDHQRIAAWSRALALRLDTQVDDAKMVLGTLLNFGLNPPSRIELRSRSGELRDAVLQAVLNSEMLVGSRLREALGWFESPDDWTGYRPDEWRTIEEVLRYLDGLAARVPDERSLALLLARMLRGAKIIDIALIRYALAKELKKRAQGTTTCKALQELYERRRFFDIAGHSISGCDKAMSMIKLKVIPEGWFFMGAPDSEERSWPNEQPRHRVRLARFWISCTEVTNELYELFDKQHEQARRQLDARYGGKAGECRDQHPVVRVSWYEAWCFAEWLGMSLPTEAQWEKAARGKNAPLRPQEIPQEPEPFWFPQDALSSVAWFSENSCGLGTRRVNEQVDTSITHVWELGGMCGNVWEWCQDMQGRKYSSADREFPGAYPDASETNHNKDVITNRMIKGGSHDSPWWNCRHAVRQFTYPTVRADTIGFRVCTSVSPNWRQGST